jgi:antitoxin MazE
MTTTVQKWGNSMALRLPRAIVESVQVQQGTLVHIHVVGGKIVIVPQRNRKPRLKELLALIKPENLHGETDWGIPQGREVW